MRWRVASMTGIACLSATAALALADGAASGENIEFHWGVKVPLRDGIELSATLYRPAGAAQPAPCVLVLSPYVADTSHEVAVYFASHGYPVAIIDSRGRGNSQGQFRPFIQEAKDGYDAVEWFAREPYCNGKVAMWGGSYFGFAQWATAKEFPPHLATIVPTAAPYMGLDFPMRNNIFYPFAVQWLTFTAGRTSQTRINADAAFWSGLYRQWHESGRAFREADTMFGHPSPIFQEWLAHPQPDAYWDAQNPTANEYARLSIPILTITGSYDDDQPGALEHYQQYMRAASPAARARHYLIIGPWNHAGTRRPATQFGGLTVGQASVIDMAKLHLDWYGWTMRGGARPALLQKPVAYYVMGAERWRYAQTLEAVTARRQPYFLASTRNANDVFAAGDLQESPGRGAPDTYTYDPREVQGPEVQAEWHSDAASLVDQSVTFALRGRALVYHSAPLARDTEISGFFRLSLWIAIDQPDTDFYVSVYDIGPHGDCVRLSTDALRARYRQGMRTPQLIRTKAPLQYDFTRFTFVSREVKRGHRLRLVIAPMGRLVESTFAEKNYNAGGVVAEESAQDAKSVTVRVYHDATHPSALYVPVGQTEAAPDSSARVAAPLSAPDTVSK